MKKEWTIYGLGALLLVLCGCGPELAQVNYGSEEAEWTRGIQGSYRGYRPPRTAPPAIKDNVSPRLIEAEENQTAEESAEQEENGEVVIPDAVDDASAIPAETTEALAAASAEKGDVSATAEAGEKKDAAVDGAASDNLEFTVYTVKAGDTLSKIAREQYGDAQKYDVIVKANGITDPAKVRIGTKLQIPKL